MATLRDTLIEFGQNYGVACLDGNIARDDLLEATAVKLTGVMGVDVNGHLEAAKHSVWRRVAYVERFGTEQQKGLVRGAVGSMEFLMVDDVNDIDKRILPVFTNVKNMVEGVQTPTPKETK